MKLDNFRPKIGNFEMFHLSSFSKLLFLTKIQYKSSFSDPQRVICDQNGVYTILTPTISIEKGSLFDQKLYIKYLKVYVFDTKVHIFDPKIHKFDPKMELFSKN